MLRHPIDNRGPLRALVRPQQGYWRDAHVRVVSLKGRPHASHNPIEDGLAHAVSTFFRA
ncbi:hypothetical protein RHRU231_960060 [Rhodococcus ruber]|uniref:Uncharacterized protein n=1 Tax=Rhodococcus ruber TaxID=1830 RepID=A0A098BXT3_9NOCA|nr:hypothetical protein RHRU231_960060 [Rhodococcus ruber]